MTPHPWFARWFVLVQRYAVFVIAASVVAAALCLNYTVKNLRFNTDTEDLMSRDLPWNRAYLEYKRAFPQTADTIVIVVDGDTPDEARDASLKLAEALRRVGEQFEWVYAPQSLPFFRENGLLFLSVEDLGELADNLAKAQPFLARLQSDPSLQGLFKLLEEAVTEGEGDFDLNPAFQRVAAVLRAARLGQRQQLSWEELISGKDAGVEDRRAYIVVKPRLDFGSLLPGEAAIKAIRELARALDLRAEHGVRVRLTGGAALSYEELESVSLGTQNAGIGSLLLVTAVMFVGLRSVWLTVGSLVVLVLGLIYTATFATLAVGQLNLISIAFAVMYIGLGADYAIYLCLRYSELARVQQNAHEALKQAACHVGGSLVLCTLTTSIGFFAFIPTAFVGVAELGLISGTGMFISLLVTLAVLPAMLSLIPRPRAATTPGAAGLRLPPQLLRLPLRYPRAICAGAAILSALSAYVLPRSTFDYNPLNLQDPSSESVQTFNDLLANSKRSPWSLGVVKGSLDEARAAKERLAGLATVREVMNIESFIPKDQDEKLAIIDDMALSLGPSIALGNYRPSDEPPDARPLEAFLEILNRAGGSGSQVPLPANAAGLATELQAFLERLNTSDAPTRERLLAQLETSLTASLPGRLEALRDSLQAGPVSLEDLPPELTERWLTGDGRALIEVYPRGNLRKPEAVAAFVEEVRRVEPEASGAPVNYLEGSRTVVAAFQQAFIYALSVITVVLAVFMRRKRDIALVLTPLLLAALWTCAAAVLLGIQFNFANIIVLPLLLGMGVDNGIHMVHRFRTAPPLDGTILGTSTARAVVLSALTNTSAFSNLAISPHQGTASMGIMLSLGITLMLMCTLVVLPSLLALIGSESRARLA